MPTTKSRLGKAELRKYVADLEELRSEGSDIKIPSGWLEDSRVLDVRVLPDGSTNVAENLSGTVVYTVHLRLIARQPHVILLDADMDTDWDQDIVLESLRRDQPLGGSKSFQRRKPIYRLGSQKHIAGEFLNDDLASFLHFNHCGDMVEGVLLFSGLKPIPDCYRLGMSVPFRLTLLDQFEHQIHCEAQMVVVREKKRKIGDAANSMSARCRTRRATRRASGLWS